MMHLIQVAYLTETPLPELGGVSQHYHLLRGIDHVMIKMRLCNVARSKAVIQIQPVDADKELAAHHLGQKRFGIGSDDGGGALSK
jgi:hypothetical protein